MSEKNIVLASDDHYAQHLTVTLKSLLENNRSGTFNIFVFDGGIREENKAKIALTVQPYRCRMTYLEVDDSLFRELDTGRLSIATYYRLLMTECIHVDKVLYLDVDLIVNASIDELYETDIDDVFAAAVVDAWTGTAYKKRLGMDEDADYFNAGVMLINLKKWREAHLFEQFLAKVRDKNLVLSAHDQDILNLTFNGRWKPLPLKYNQYEKQPDLNQEMLLRFFSKAELKEAREHPVIIHYIGGRKPWHYRTEHVHKALYWHYLNMTPYRDYKPADRTLRNILSKNTPMIIRNPKRFFRTLFSSSKL